jgi:hypothetical protein
VLQPKKNKEKEKKKDFIWKKCTLILMMLLPAFAKKS